MKKPPPPPCSRLSAEEKAASQAAARAEAARVVKGVAARENKMASMREVPSRATGEGRTKPNEQRSELGNRGVHAVWMMRDVRTCAKHGGSCSATVEVTVMRCNDSPGPIVDSTDVA